MRDRFYRVIVAVAAIVTLHASSVGAQKQVVDARITIIKCPADLQESTGGTFEPLLPTDVGKPLRAGNKIRCAGTGSLEIILPEGPKTITSVGGPFTIPSLSAQVTKDVLTFGSPGATRGVPAPSRVTWPVENSVVVPERLTFRWTPIAGKLQVSILSENKDATLWGPTAIDGGAGTLRSVEVATILSNYKSQAEDPKLLLLVTRAGGREWAEIHFGLLDQRHEEDLQRQLEFWKSHSEGLALHLGRSYAFSRYRLYAEAADEYDIALKSASKSRYFLEEGVKVNRLAGRIERAKELELRAASQPQTANP